MPPLQIRKWMLKEVNLHMRTDSVENSVEDKFCKKFYRYSIVGERFSSKLAMVLNKDYKNCI